MPDTLPKKSLPSEKGRMPTQHVHRLILIVPAAMQNATNSFFSSQLNEGGNAFTVPLSATGSAPATHYWNNRACTAGDVKKIAQRLCNLANITLPGTWDSMTKAQRKQWFLDQRNDIKATIGVWVMSADNDGTWDSPDDALAHEGLQRISS